jgi:signal transduction histidine kinase
MSVPVTRWFSLRRRLTLWLLVGVAAGWLGAVGYAYVGARHEVEELIEALEAHEEDSDEHRRHARHELLEHFVGVLLSPLLLGLPVLGGWIWFATRRGLSPLVEVAQEIEQRTADQLDPVIPETAPAELQPLLKALNSLFSRLGMSIERERAFTADAAHELRTPLAALVAQAEVAARARDSGEREHALAQILIGSHRAARLVDQLLTLARLDPTSSLAMEPVRLDVLLTNGCAEHGAVALERGIELELDAVAETTVRGHADMLGILVRNLLDNALRYTPSGGLVKVALSAGEDAVVLVVSDNGPGIPAGKRGDAMRRFHRLADQASEGSGLGLSIVARIAELHGANLELGDGLGEPGGPGLAVTVRLPPANSRPA